MSKNLEQQLSDLKAEQNRLLMEKQLVEARKENARLVRRVTEARAPLITKAWLTNYIATQPREKVMDMLGRALVRLWERQTQDEQASRDTVHTNGRGFRAGGDDAAGSDAAETFQRTGRLTEAQYQAWVRPAKHGRPRICAYSAQLNEIAWALKDSK